MMKDNKRTNGFTLIELLAVIVILAILGLIAIPSILNSINDSKEKLYAEQVDRLLSAADNWAASNDNELPNATFANEPITLSVSELQQSGLLKNEDVKNPLNGNKNMQGTIKIYYDDYYSQYVSIYCDAEYGNKYYTSNEDYNSVMGKCNSRLIGDVNGDGKVDNSDVSKLKDFLANNANCPNDFADLNKDGVTDEKDLELLNGLLSGDSVGVNEKDADINGDGVTNILDLAFIRRCLAGYDLSVIVVHFTDGNGNDYGMYASDFNGDGFIDSDDVTLLENYVNGKK